MGVFVTNEVLYKRGKYGEHKLCVCCFSVIIAIVIACSGFFIYFILRFDVENYGPTDTRLLSLLSPVFSFINICQSWNLRMNYEGSHDYSASLYMLNSQPLLHMKENFSFSIDNEEQDYDIAYMNKGSALMIDACYGYSTVIKVVQGHAKVVKSISLNNDECKSSYTIEKDDFYSITVEDSSPALHVIFTVHLKHYTVNTTSIVSSCTLDYPGSMCSLKAEADGYALLTIDSVSSDDVDWLDKILIGTRCIFYLWVYIVPPMVVISFTLLCAFCCCCCEVRRDRKRKRDMEEASEVRAKFKHDWVKGRAPEIETIIILSNEGLKKKFDRYRKSLGHYSCVVEQYYHGTKLCCKINQEKGLCGYKSCRVCRVSASGFKTSHIGTNVNYQRFGRGFYLAPNSSKSHEYTEGAYGYRALLLCDVCPGNKYKRHKSQPSLNGPPSPAYHSLYGTAGKDLNYDEVLLWNSCAILPRYIIVYKLNGVHKLVH